MDKNTGISFPLAVALTGVFTVANGLITLPLPGKNLTAFFIASALGVLFLPLSALFLKTVPDKRNIVFRAVSVILALILLYWAFADIEEHCEFIYRAVLTRADMYLIKAVFIACVFFLAASGYYAVYKFAFLAGVLSSATLAVLFILSFKTFDVKNLYEAISLSDISVSDIFKYFGRLIVPSFSAVLFLRLTDSGFNARKVFFGISLGVVLCITAVLDCVLSFGMPLAGKLDYPYIDDISTVTAGSLFTRMDAFAHFVFFVAYLLKAAVCIKTSARLLSRALKKQRVT